MSFTPEASWLHSHVQYVLWHHSEIHLANQTAWLQRLLEAQTPRLGFAEGQQPLGKVRKLHSTSCGGTSRQQTQRPALRACSEYQLLQLRPCFGQCTRLQGHGVCPLHPFLRLLRWLLFQEAAGWRKAARQGSDNILVRVPVCGHARHHRHA